MNNNTFNKINNFNVKNNFELTEKNILCNCIEQYINIANLNNTTLDDYISIIAFIKILKKQYPNYVKSFDYYLSIFKSNGIINQYNINDSNIAKKYFLIYEGNEDKAYEIVNGFIPGCSNRFMNYMIAIGICGPPTSTRKKMILAQAYSYNSYAFAKQAIYYTNLYLQENSDSLYYLELNADNYFKIKEYDIALDYYMQVFKQQRNNTYLYKKIINVYKRKHDLGGAITFLKNEKKSFKNLFDINKQQIINRYLKDIKN